MPRSKSPKPAGWLFSAPKGVWVVNLAKLLERTLAAWAGSIDETRDVKMAPRATQEILLNIVIKQKEEQQNHELNKS